MKAFRNHPGKSGETARPKTHKNFFQVNIGQREQKELRVLAAAFGIKLRDFLNYAIRDKKYEYQQLQRLAEGRDLNPLFLFSLTRTLTNNN